MNTYPTVGSGIIPSAPYYVSFHSSLRLDPLLEAASQNEEAHFLDEKAHIDDLSSRPPSPLSPLTDCEYSDDLIAYKGTFKVNQTPHGPSKSPDAVNKKRKRSSASARRSRKRVAEASSKHASTRYTVSPSVVDTYVATQPIKIALDTIGLPSSSSSGAWTGAKTAAGGTKPPTVRELEEEGVRILEWDGTTTYLIVDSQNRIVAVLVGRPKDPSWTVVIDDAVALMTEVRHQGLEDDLFPKKCLSHRRGSFVALLASVSYGGGQMRPGNLVHPKPLRRLLEKLISSHSIRRIAGFQSSAFAAYAPKLYRYYAQTFGKLFERYEGLVHNFNNSVFPAISFNCGPTTVAVEHTDSGNLAHGLCALTALGNYNSITGGHLILVTFGIAFQFPPGSTALIPSGCVTHANAAIQDGEFRLSIAQYAAGGLFRWVTYGFKAVKSMIKTSQGKRAKKAIDGAAGERWKVGLDMFSKLSELKQDLQAVFGAQRG